MITISLDYDNTFTLMPDYWLQFIKNAPPHIKIYCITMRHESEGDSMDPRLKDLVSIIFTARQAKREHAKAQGIEVDIWIDDCPEFVFMHSQ